jgi:hypothetical protein
VLNRTEGNASKKIAYPFKHLQESFMSADKVKIRPQARSRFNTDEDYEVRDWTHKFQVAPKNLKSLTKSMGASAKAVEDHLKNSR